VAGIVETHLDLIIKGQIFFVGNLLQEWKTLFSILDCVEGDFRVGSLSALRIMELFLEGGIFFLHSSRIQDDYWKKCFGCRREQDVSGESLFDKFGNEPAVVQVNVCEEDMINLAWRNGEGLPVSVGIVPFLKQPTIDKNLHSTST
jgi:hypothetical protein